MKGIFKTGVLWYNNIITVIILHYVCEACGVFLQEIPANGVIRRDMQLMTFTVLDGETKEIANMLIQRKQ